MKVAVYVEGLKEFRADLRRAADATPREVTRAIRRAGEPLKERATGLAPRRSGALASSARLEVRATEGRLSFTAPYAAGAEFGLRGKWKGFRRYGPRGNRFIFRALDETADEVAETLDRELREIVTAHGWFRE